MSSLVFPVSFLDISLQNLLSINKEGESPCSVRLIDLLYKPVPIANC